MPTYHFRVKPELLWGLFVAAIVAAAGALESIAPEQLGDHKLVVMVVAGAVARAVGAALMAQLGPGGFGSGPKPEASE
jgi:hypothetical protein